MMQRTATMLVWTVVTVTLVWWFRNTASDPTGLIWGDRLDTIHHAWGLWWMAHREGLDTQLVSFPFGEHGSLLAPVSTLLVMPIYRVFGLSIAYSALCFSSVFGSAVALAVLARSLGGSPLSSALAAAMFVFARPVLAQVAMGTVEGGVLWPILLGAAAGVVWPERRRGFGLLVGGLFGLSVIENPYCLPVGMVLSLGFALRRLRTAGSNGREHAMLEVGLAALSGIAVVGTRMAMVGGDVGGNLPAAWSTELFGQRLPVVDPGGFPWWGLLVPAWSPAIEGPTARIVEQGVLLWPGYLLGALALCARRHRSVLWTSTALLFGLSLGSMPLGTSTPIYGPFLVLNTALDAFLHPLTQPTRFLPMAVCSLALLASQGVDRLRTRRPNSRFWMVSVSLAVCAEGLVLGSPSVSVETWSLRTYACWEELRDAGSVHLVMPTTMQEDNVLPPHAMAMMMQLAHEAPSTRHGIGGWTPVARPEDWDQTIAALDEAANLTGSPKNVSHAVHTLHAAGVDTLIVPSHLTADEPPLVRCGDWHGYRTGAFLR